MPGKLQIAGYNMVLHPASKQVSKLLIGGYDRWIYAQQASYRRLQYGSMCSRLLIGGYDIDLCQAGFRLQGTINMVLHPASKQASDWRVWQIDRHIYKPTSGWLPSSCLNLELRNRQTDRQTYIYTNLHTETLFQSQFCLTSIYKVCPQSQFCLVEMIVVIFSSNHNSAWHIPSVHLLIRILLNIHVCRPSEYHPRITELPAIHLHTDLNSYTGQCNPFVQNKSNQPTDRPTYRPL